MARLFVNAVLIIFSLQVFGGSSARIGYGHTATQLDSLSIRVLGDGTRLTEFEVTRLYGMERPILSLSVPGRQPLLLTMSVNTDRRGYLQFEFVDSENHRAYRTLSPDGDSIVSSKSENFPLYIVVSHDLRVDRLAGGPAFLELRRTHDQFVQLQSRGIERFRANNDGVLMLVEGGDLGILQHRSQMGAYLRSLAGLIGAGRTADVRAQSEQVEGSTIKTYGYQYIDEIPARGSRILIERDTGSGHVLRVKGLITDLALARPIRVNSAEAATRIAIEAIDAASLLTPFGKIDKHWDMTGLGPTLFWSGFLTGSSREDSYAFLVNATTLDVRFSSGLRRSDSRSAH